MPYVQVNGGEGRGVGEERWKIDKRTYTHFHIAVKSRPRREPVKLVLVQELSQRAKSIPSISFCFVLFCFVLFCFVLFCFVLFCFVLFCFVLFCFVLFCFVLFCFVLFCFVLFHLILVSEANQSASLSTR